MKQTKWPEQIISVGGMLALLLAAALFERWQVSLQENFGETFDMKFSNLRLWSVPIAAVFFAVCVLILYNFFRKHNYTYTAILFLIVGLSIVFYPTLSVSFGLVSIFKISANYFVDSVLFYTGAFMAAIGLSGLAVVIRLR